MLHGRLDFSPFFVKECPDVNVIIDTWGLSPYRVVIMYANNIFANKQTEPFSILKMSEVRLESNLEELCRSKFLLHSE